MLLIMVVCFIHFYKKRRIYFKSNWFRHNWRQDWFSDCYTGRNSESANEILKKRYARGEINKEVFEQMKKDIKNHS